MINKMKIKLIAYKILRDEDEKIKLLITELDNFNIINKINK